MSAVSDQIVGAGLKPALTRRQLNTASRTFRISVCRSTTLVWQHVILSEAKNLRAPKSRKHQFKPQRFCAFAALSVRAAWDTASLRFRMTLVWQHVILSEAKNLRAPKSRKHQFKPQRFFAFAALSLRAAWDTASLRLRMTLEVIARPIVTGCVLPLRLEMAPLTCMICEICGPLPSPLQLRMTYTVVASCRRQAICCSGAERCWRNTGWKRPASRRRCC